MRARLSKLMQTPRGRAAAARAPGHGTTCAGAATAARRWARSSTCSTTRCARPTTRVELEARPDAAGGVTLYVHDNGPGVPEAAAKIFEPFYTMRSNGTGLGLAVVQSVARAHGGSARVEAGRGGASFSIHVPRVAEELLPSGAARASGIA